MKQQHLTAALALALAAWLPAGAAHAATHRVRHHVTKHRTVVHRHVHRTVKRTTTTTTTTHKSSSGTAGSSAGPKPSSDTHSSITRPGDYAFAIQQDGRQRTYRVHVPPGYTPSEPAPLVVALRPGDATTAQARDDFYGLVREADQQGFVTVIADPARDGKTSAWNAGEAGSGGHPRANDVNFIETVVNNVFGQMSIARQRIYAAGMSDGGMMAYRLACRLPYMFTAVASVAGTDNTPDCAPGRPVSVLHLHAKNDRQVPFDGGNPLGSAKVAHLTSAPQTVAKWAKLDGCQEAPQPVLQQAGAMCEAYSYCRGRAEVRLCTTDTGGHSWPGSLKHGADTPSQAISATDTIWAFFSAH